MKLALVVIILIVLLVIISKSNNTFKPYFIIIFHLKCNFFGPFQGYKKYLLKCILITWGQFFFTQNDGLPNPFDVLGLISMVLHTTI